MRCLSNYGLDSTEVICRNLVDLKGSFVYIWQISRELEAWKNKTIPQINGLVDSSEWQLIVGAPIIADKHRLTAD